MSGTQIEIRRTIFKPGIQKEAQSTYLQVSKKKAMSNHPMSVLVIVSYCYLVYLNVEIKRIDGEKSWLKKGVSDLQGQATAWVSSWRQDTCVAWHFSPF